MIHKKPTIKLLIAVNEYLYFLGIKALINHLGFEPEFVFINTKDELDKAQLDTFDYLILHHKLFDNQKNKHLKHYIFNFKGKVLIIGSRKMSPDFYQHFIHPTNTDVQLVEKMQDFFSSSTILQLPTENNILSTREIEILKEVALGFSNKEIADRLFISINTVITHRKNITEKLGIKTIPGLTVYAIMNNFINPDEVTF